MGSEMCIRDRLPHITMPEAPALAPGETRLANVFVTGRLQALTPDNLFPILETAYPEPPATGPSVAERLMAMFPRGR